MTSKQNKLQNKPSVRNESVDNKKEEIIPRQMGCGWFRNNLLFFSFKVSVFFFTSVCQIVSGGTLEKEQGIKVKHHKKKK